MSDHHADHTDGEISDHPAAGIADALGITVEELADHFRGVDWFAAMARGPVAAAVAQHQAAHVDDLFEDTVLTSQHLMPLTIDQDAAAHETPPMFGMFAGPSWRGTPSDAEAAETDARWAAWRNRPPLVDYLRSRWSDADVDDYFHRRALREAAVAELARWRRSPRGRVVLAYREARERVLAAAAILRDGVEEGGEL